MTSRNARDPQETLRGLLRDASSEPAPELDWNRVEQRLMSRIGVPNAPRRYSIQPMVWWGGLAVAASAALWLLTRHTSTSVAPPPAAPVVVASQSLRKDGDALPVGSRISADTRELTVEHPDRATWTLAPGSSALLTERGARIGLRLEQGSVLSRVVPSPTPETFVVEAARARVAVHGTVFRVSLEGGRVLVQVSEGTVGVGPRGAAPAFFLKAPASGDFAEDGRSGSTDGYAVAQASARRSEPLKLLPVRAPSAAPLASLIAPAPSAELPREPSINDIESGVARIVDATSDCFSHFTKSTDGVQITVRTALTLQIKADGSASDVDFQPPLSPEAAECAANGIAQIKFAASQEGTKVTRMLELKR